MNILIIKLSPIAGLNSSTMRALALANGFYKLGANIDFLTIPLSTTHVSINDESNFNHLNVIYTDRNKNYDSIVKDSDKNKIKSFVVSNLRNVYHKFNIFNYTKDIADNIDIDILPRREYDVIISISDPKTSHIATENLIKQGLTYKKWVQYWGDPLALDITNKNIYPKKILSKIERKLFSNSDLLVYASPVTLRQQKDLYKKFARKMIFVPTPYLSKSIYGTKARIGKLQLGYFGAYNSRVRDIQPLYQAVTDLLESTDLTIIGDSDIKLDEKDNIKILDRQEIGQFEAEMDFLVCILNNSGTQIPGKLFHSAGTDKPILLLLDGEYGDEIGEYFSQFNNYFMCQNEKHAILDKLSEISDYKETVLPVEDFTGTSIAKLILDELNYFNNEK